MAYDAKAIANRFLEIAREHGTELNSMKLEKLVYFANGWNLAIKGKPLIDEQVEAWSYGPVIPSLHYEFRQFGNEKITEPARTYQLAKDDGAEENDGLVVLVPSLRDDPGNAEFTEALLARIWEVYGKFTPIQLANMTHNEDAPWHRIVEQYGGAAPRGTDIPPEMIREYFLGLAAEKAKA
jgi:uncharacterized phage-associated protein